MNTLCRILADTSISGEGLVHNLLFALIIVICVAAIYFVGRWFIGKLTTNATALMAWDGFFLIVGLIIAINFLLTLIGKPFLRW